MVAGLGGGNGFMFRTRRQEDAEVFVEEFKSRGRPRGSRRVRTAAVVAVVVVLVALALVDWLV